MTDEENTDTAESRFLLSPEWQAKRVWRNVVRTTQRLSATEGKQSVLVVKNVR